MILAIFSVGLFFCICIAVYVLLLRMMSGSGRSYLYMYSLISGMIYFGSNILSSFGAFTRMGVNCFYCLILILLIAANALIGKDICLERAESQDDDKFIYLIYGIALLILLLSILRGILYPPENNDSITYHLVRAFYYYKIGKVTNVPSTYVIMNYSGPANAILAAHWFILTGGSEFGLNLIQMPSMIVVGVAVYQIGIELEVLKKYAVLAGGIAFSLPLVILQAATTQNDLLAAGHAVCAVCFFIRSYKKMDLLDMICLGINGGGVFLSKIASASVILPFFIVYIVYGSKYKKIQTIKRYFIALTAALSVTFSFWLRNFVDLRGDFLALGPSRYMDKDGAYHLVDHIGKVIIYLGYCCCGYIAKLNGLILVFLRKVYHFIGATEYGKWDAFYSVPRQPCHDFFPYGISLWIALVGLFVVIFGKKRRVHRAYAVLTSISLILGILIMPGTGFIPSVTRYLLGNVIICIPLIAIMLDSVSRSDRVKDKSVKGSLIFIGISVMILNGVMCNFYDIGSPLKDVTKTSYEEKRDALAPRSLSWVNIDEEIKKIIDEEQCKVIGICEVKLTHIYTFLHKLTDDDYDVRSIYGEFGDTYIDEDLIPDIIIWVDEYSVPDMYKIYRGQRYGLIYASGDVLLNGCQAMVYIRR